VVGWVSAGLGFGIITFDRIFGYIFTPLAILMGVDGDDYVTVGCLLGQKTLLNEFVAVCAPHPPVIKCPSRGPRVLTNMLTASARMLLLAAQFQSVDTIQNGFSDEFEPMSERSLNIVTYALCGFSNLGSVGMTMSAMTAIAPGQTRKPTISPSRLATISADRAAFH
jgi:CNT family concentrative nucleoside transporter